MSDDGIPPGMDAERWKRIETILDQALTLDSEERSAFLERAYAEQPELRSDIESLLAADAESTGLLRPLSAGLVGSVTEPGFDGPVSGDRIA